MDRFFRYLPHVALAAAAVLVVVLGRQKSALVDENSRLRERILSPYPGMYVPSFRTATLDGAPVVIGEAPAGARQVLFVFTTTCQYCKATLPAWKRIAAESRTAEGGKPAVLGISLDSVDVTRKYTADHKLTYPVAQLTDPKLIAMYRAGSVPLTLVLDEQGRTIHSRVGEISTPAAIDSVITAVRWKPAPPPAAAPTGQQASR